MGKIVSRQPPKPAQEPLVQELLTEDSEPISPNEEVLRKTTKGIDIHHFETGEDHEDS